MIAVLAEDRSDAESLVVLVKRILGTPNAKVAKKGFGGCGELYRKAGRHIDDFADSGVERFIICHDSDGNDPSEIREKVARSIRAKTQLPDNLCIIVPVQEIEAWIIADEEAISRVIPSFVIGAVPRPEAVQSPKQWLQDKSRKGRSRPLYIPTTHNAKVAEHLNLAKVGRKCPSFQELIAFISPSNQSPRAS